MGSLSRALTALHHRYEFYDLKSAKSAQKCNPKISHIHNTIKQEYNQSWMWTGSHCVCSSLGLFVISAKPKPEPLYGNGFWLGVLWLQMQTVFILNYYKPKRLERHASTLIFFLLWDALPLMLFPFNVKQDMNLTSPLFISAKARAAFKCRKFPAAMLLRTI